MTLVILEGSDRAGKSTVAEAVRRQLLEVYPGDQVELWHAGPPKKHPLDEYERPLFTYRPCQRRHVICDRWHVGESVYPAVLNRPTRFTPPVRAHVEAFLRSRGALLVHVHANSDVLSRRLAAEEHECPEASLVSREQLLDARDRFFHEMRRSILHYVGIETTHTTPTSVDDAARLVVRLANTVERDACSLSELRTYVGGPHPRVLLVGDVRHAHRCMRATVDALHAAQLDPAPAFMPYPATSGEYLLRSVTSLCENGTVGLINANDVDDPYIAWKTLDEPITVALGRRAYDTVKTWVSGAVPHPQYVRRFYNSHTAWYDLLIQRASTGVNLLGERPNGVCDSSTDDDDDKCEETQ